MPTEGPADETTSTSSPEPATATETATLTPEPSATWTLEPTETQTAISTPTWTPEPREKAIATSAATLTSEPTETATTILTVRNYTDSSVWYVYISPSTSDSWGDDWLGDSVIIAGESMIFSVPEGCPGRIFPSVQRSMLIGAFWSPPGVVVMQAT